MRIHEVKTALFNCFKMSIGFSSVMKMIDFKRATSSILYQHADAVTKGYQEQTPAKTNEFFSSAQCPSTQVIDLINC